jgi:hypothetical protein
MAVEALGWRLTGLDSKVVQVLDRIGLNENSYELCLFEQSV